MRVREEQGLELLDAGASDAFAVADHQIAHVYLRDEADRARVAAVCGALAGVDLVLQGRARAEAGLAHHRAGDLVLVAAAGRWFSYDYWLDDRRAPDFARTVDIHRKPGYDPCELFIDPALTSPRLRIAATLLRKTLGFRALMKVIPLDPSLVRGSHGRVDQPPEHRPVLITTRTEAGVPDEISCRMVKDVILSELFDGEARRHEGT